MRNQFAIGIAAVVLAASMPTSSARAKCATGLVAVKGTVVGEVHGSLRIDVVLRTPKGDFSNGGDVIDKNFNVEVPFRTFNSWSPIFGHRCTNEPETADVKLTAGDRVVGEKVLKFKENFETHDSVTFRVKQELTFEVGRRHQQP